MNAYEVQRWQSYRVADDGMELMANFVARIVAETRYDDGLNTSSVLTVEGEMPPADPDDPEPKPRKLPAIDITAEEFAAMNWPMKRWGVRVIVMPISGCRDDLRTMIQAQSDPKLTTVYKHTGWVKVGREQYYLHKGGGIGKAGNRSDITVQLPQELDRFDLTCEAKPKDSVRASLALLDLVKPSVSWPLLAATLAPLYGQCDFGVHVTGRTGSYKSELLSLYQSHYGAGLDARHLPGSWSSTGNANECLAFLAKNAVIVIDDFVPGGTTWQVRALQAQADKLFRAQGNQAGRARLTDASNLQQTMFPRGIVFSTGEDTPAGHSVRGRLLIRELEAGDIEAKYLTLAQKARALYPGTVAWLAQSLAQVPADLAPRIEQVRDENHGIGHGRTSTMLGRLIAVAEDFLERARAAGFIDTPAKTMLEASAREAIMEAGEEQASFLEDSDPVDSFCAAIRQVLATGGGHVLQTNGGVPQNAEQLGHTAERSLGEMPLYKTRGPCIGWCRFKDDELYLDVAAGYPVVEKAMRTETPLSKQTMIKRLKQAGLIKRAEVDRNRHTIRIVCQNSTRQVLCLSLTKVMQWETVNDRGSDPEPRERPARVDAGEE